MVARNVPSPAGVHVTPIVSSACAEGLDHPEVAGLDELAHPSRQPAGVGQRRGQRTRGTVVPRHGAVRAHEEVALVVRAGALLDAHASSLSQRRRRGCRRNSTFTRGPKALRHGNRTGTRGASAPLVRATVGLALFIYDIR